MCLNTDSLFLTHPFAKAGPLSPSAVTALRVAATPLDSTAPTQKSTRPPNLQSLSSRSLWHQTVTRVLHPATSHFCFCLNLFTPSCEGTRPTWTCPGSTTLHHLSCPGASGKSSKDSLPFSSAASLITLSCPWLFFSL